MAPRFFHFCDCGPHTAFTFARVAATVPEDPRLQGDLASCRLAVLLCDFEDDCAGGGIRPFIAAAVGLAGSDEEYIPDAPPAEELGLAGILCGPVLAAASGKGIKRPAPCGDRRITRCGAEVFRFCRIAKVSLPPHRVMIAGLLDPPASADGAGDRACQAAGRLVDFIRAWDEMLSGESIDGTIERALASASSSLWLTSSMRRELALMLLAFHERKGVLPGDVLSLPSIRTILGSGRSPKAKGKEVIAEIEALLKDMMR